MRGFRPALPVAILVIAVFTAVLAAQREGWLDTEPPVLTVRAPSTTPGAGTDDAPWIVDIRVHDARPGVGTLTVELDGVPEALPVTGGTWRLPHEHLAPGSHEIVVIARDASWSRNGAVERITIEIPAPEPEPEAEPEAEPEPDEVPPAPGP